MHPRLDDEDQDDEKEVTWRGHVALCLDSRAFHWTVIALSSVEFSISLAEILHDYLDSSSPSCLAPYRGGEQSKVFETLDACSLFLTSLFVLEIPLNLVAFGVRYYLPKTRHWFLHLFDAFVVTGAFVLSISADGPFASVASLLIVLRLWRVLKLVVSLQVANHEWDESSRRTRPRRRSADDGKGGSSSSDDDEARDRLQDEEDKGEGSKDRVIQRLTQRTDRRH
ncbi:hypothetical protein JCM3766R1_003131 [Sporobolomyces carnicolor]